jgi:hypothetical protein
VLLALGATFAYAAANPTAPNSLVQGWTSTFVPGNYPTQTHNAVAGNITALVLTALGQTKAWQGYYGNITGSITLDDANNFTFYNWTSAEPQGKIYATLNSSIAWLTVECFNYTANTGLGYANETSMETFYGIQMDDVDGVRETFNETSHPAFQVGSRTMSGCPTTYVFRDDQYQTADFVNVLLYDNTTVASTGWIYTTIIENKTNGAVNDATCYHGQLCDFQLLVNDDGHGTDTAATTYYFWVELQ